MLGALELTTGRWVYRLGRRRAADFIALLRMLAEAFPRHVPPPGPPPAPSPA